MNNQTMTPELRDPSSTPGASGRGVCTICRRAGWLFRYGPYNTERGMARAVCASPVCHELARKTFTMTADEFAAIEEQARVKGAGPAFGQSIVDAGHAMTPMQEVPQPVFRAAMEAAVAGHRDKLAELLTAHDEIPF